MNRIGLYTLGVASVFAYASAAAAQGTGNSAAAAPAAMSAASTSTEPAFSLGVLGGVSIPTGNLSDGASSGWHGGAFIGLNPGLPISFRIEGVVHDFGTKSVSPATGVTVKDHGVIINANLDGVWHFPTTGMLQPYLIAGGGVYDVGNTASCSATGSGSCTGFKKGKATLNRFGINGGAGVNLKLSGLAVFAEARYHDVFTSGNSSQMVPISVGLRL